MNQLGIDISHFQQVASWPAVKAAGVSFVYAKATQGTGFNDPAFLSHVAGARSVGLPVGAYHFGQPNGGPQAQAQFFHSVAGDLDLPPVLDIEASQQAQGVAPAVIREWCRLFLAEANRLFDRPCWLYSDGGFVRANLGGTQLAPYWYARYGPSVNAPPGWTPSVWQYDDHGSVPGISGSRNVDMDRWLGTDSEFALFCGQQPAPVPHPTPTPAEDDDMRIIGDGTGKKVLTNGIYKKLPDDAAEANLWGAMGFPGTNSATGYAYAVTLPDFP